MTQQPTCNEKQSHTTNTIQPTKECSMIRKRFLRCNFWNQIF